MGYKIWLKGFILKELKTLRVKNIFQVLYKGKVFIALMKKHSEKVNCLTWLGMQINSCQCRCCMWNTRTCSVVVNTYYYIREY